MVNNWGADAEKIAREKSDAIRCQIDAKLVKSSAGGGGGASSIAS